MFNFSLIQKIKKKFFPFYKNRDLQFVFKKLQEDFSNQTRVAMFVGGCVRKYLSNEEVDDIDIATLLTIDQIKEKFKNTTKIDVPNPHAEACTEDQLLTGRLEFRYLSPAAISLDSRIAECQPRYLSLGT